MQSAVKSDFLPVLNMAVAVKCLRLRVTDQKIGGLSSMATLKACRENSWVPIQRHMRVM